MIEIIHIMINNKPICQRTYSDNMLNFFLKHIKFLRTIFSYIILRFKLLDFYFWLLFQVVTCNCFRVPMNCITCGALMCLNIDAVSNDKRMVFAACLALAVIGHTSTELCNHNRIVFEEMSSWTASTWHIGMKTAF